MDTHPRMQALASRPVLEASGALQRLALAICLSAATASAFILPVIAGALVEGVPIPVENIGLVFAAELASIALGSLAIHPSVRTFAPRVTIGIAMAMIVLSNVLCTRLAGVAALVVLRSCAGLAEGVAQAAIVSLVARLDAPHRVFAFLYTLQALLLTAMFLLIPDATARWGFEAAILLMAGLAFIGVLLVPLVRTGAADEAKRLLMRAPWRRDFTVILFGWFMFQLGQNTLWVYAERIAHDLGISFAQTNLIFAISAAGTIPAAWLAGWCEVRVRPVTLTVLATVMSAGSILGFPLAHGPVAYGIASVTFCAALFFAFPVFSTLAVKTDPSGRLPSLLPAVQASGMALGPALASVTLGLVGSFSILAALASACSLITLCAVGPSLRVSQSR